jgi:RNA polymerase sigma-70 factor (ECF subfamily)
MASTDEAELLALAQEGDKRAYGRLVRLHIRRVRACAVGMLGDGGDADDAVQETFVRAWRALARFDGRSQLSTWLYRICVNVCLNHLRKRKRHEAHDLADPRTPEPVADPAQNRSDPERALAVQQLQGHLQVALDGLSETLRTTVILCLVQGMPQKEAAAVLGCSEGTIAWRVHEARRRLRRALAELADGDAVETSSDEASGRDEKGTKKGRRAS